MMISDIILLYESSYERLFNFSEFENKLKNRISEFDAIRKHLPKKNFYNVLSFPANYDFETSFYNVFKIPMNVYVMQNNFDMVAAGKFMRNTGGVNHVFVPVKSTNSKREYIPRKSIKSDDITGSKPVRFSPVTSNTRLIRRQKHNVLQGYEYLPEKLDLIDLDYMGTFSPKLLGQIGTMYNEKLDNGGLLFITLNLSSYRELVATLSSTSKELGISLNDPMLSKFKKIATQGEESEEDFLKNKDFTKYGIKDTLIQKYKSISYSIIKELKSACGNKEPIYINIYKGGTTSKGRIMLRIVFKK